MRRGADRAPSSPSRSARLQAVSSPPVAGVSRRRGLLCNGRAQGPSFAYPPALGVDRRRTLFPELSASVGARISGDASPRRIDWRVRGRPGARVAAARMPIRAEDQVARSMGGSGRIRSRRVRRATERAFLVGGAGRPRGSERARQPASRASSRRARRASDR